jgi:hypothetical protein
MSPRDRPPTTSTKLTDLLATGNGNR